MECSESQWKSNSKITKQSYVPLVFIVIIFFYWKIYMVQNVNVIYHASFSIQHCKINVLGFGGFFCTVNCNAFEQ